MKLVKLIIMAAAALTAQSLLADTGARCQDVQVLRRDGQMQLQMTINLADAKIGRNDQVTLRPAIIAPGVDTAYYKPVTIYGRNMQIKIQRNPSWADKDAIEVNWCKGETNTVSYSGSVPYQDWMQVSQVVMAEDRCGCCELKETSCTHLADLDYTPAPEIAVAYITPAAEAEKNRDESGQAFLDFVVNKTDIRPDYRGNRGELAKIIQTIDLVKNDPFVTITNINIHGYASPEGTYKNNTRLATGRAAALKDYVKSLYDLPDRTFTSEATPEDWDGLRRLLEASDLADRDALLRIIDTVQDPDQRDAAMKRQYPQPYAFMLKEWYPALRHSDYKVSYVVRPLTIDEAKEVLKTNPKNLSLNEMFLVAQTYPAGSDEFNEVFKTAVTVFPDDPTANLNAACMELNAGDLDKAAGYLAKAGDTPQAVHARGLLALKQGRYADARTLLEQAKNLGVTEAEHNLKVLDRLEYLAR